MLVNCTNVNQLNRALHSFHHLHQNSVHHALTLMTRIRLQAQVMPWEGPQSAAPLGTETRQQDIVKLCVPCLDSLTIQELADKITVQWGRIYIGYG